MKDSMTFPSVRRLSFTSIQHIVTGLLLQSDHGCYLFDLESY